jgi:hypothetical protein
MKDHKQYQNCDKANQKIKSKWHFGERNWEVWKIQIALFPEGYELKLS